MAYRIEILFSGPAPESELERVKIVGTSEVLVAIDKLTAALKKAGLDCTASVRSVNSAIGSGARTRSRRHVSGPPAEPSAQQEAA